MKTQLKISLVVLVICTTAIYSYKRSHPPHKPIECKMSGNVVSAYIDTEDNQSITQFMEEGCILKPEMPPTTGNMDISVYGNVKTAERLLDSEKYEN